MTAITTLIGVLLIFNFCNRILASPLLTKFDTPVSAREYEYTSGKIKGVNVGGWLLLEPWITPSVFEGVVEDQRDTPVDEYSLCKLLGRDGCRSYLKRHWDTFITRQDFSDIKNEYQLNFVRIPIGYWAYTLLPDDPYVQGQDAYLERAINWAQEFGLQVWIDLHGLPGSQNGFDNSGHRGGIGFFDKDSGNDAIAQRVLAQITEKYLPRYSDTVVGIELVNEPFGPSIDLNSLVEYYKSGYRTVRDTGSSVPVAIHDAFLANKDWMQQFNPSQGYTDVVFDFHHYVIFTNDLYGKPLTDVLDTVCFWGKEAEEQVNRVVVGEWSAALTDCTKYLNGVNQGASRYEAHFGEGSCNGKEELAQYSAQEVEDLTRYCEAQLDAYSQGNTAGWVFWNYKTEGSLEWDFRELVRAGIFPPPPYTARKYPRRC